MRIAFIGLGKLGMPCAEALAKKGYADITGYDVVQKTSELVDIKQTLAEAVKDRDVVFIATPTPHEEGYDGRSPTSHLKPKVRLISILNTWFVAIAFHAPYFYSFKLIPFFSSLWRICRVQ